MEYWYRYEDVRHEHGTGLYLREYPVVKTTAKGVWISEYGRRRFVLTESRKKFAASTKEKALESFMARKTRQALILRAQLRNVENAIRLGKTITSDERYITTGMALEFLTNGSR